MTTFVISLIRTNTPALVGAIVGLLVSIGLQVPADAVAGLTAFLGFLFTGLYYLIVRLLEEKYPQIGILLGFAKSPDSYSKGPGVELTAKPAGNPEITVTVASPESQPVTIADIQLQDLDRVKGPDHRA